jgi:hypothetical protein
VSAADRPSCRGAHDLSLLAVATPLRTSRVWDDGFRVRALEFGVWGLGFGVWKRCKAPDECRKANQRRYTYRTKNDSNNKVTFLARAGCMTNSTHHAPRTEHFMMTRYTLAGNDLWHDRWPADVRLAVCLGPHRIWTLRGVGVGGEEERGFGDCVVHEQRPLARARGAMNCPCS